MKTIEEQLWNYIDGTLTPQEKLEIEAKIAVNLQYHQAYQEILAVHNELNQLEFDEPSMSFTRNVMEQVNLELPPVALKTKVDQRIIYFIGAFFVLSLLSIFGYAIATSDFKFDFTMPALNVDASKLTNHTALTIFLFVDVVLALIYFDSFLRRGKFFSNKKEA